MDLRVSVVLWIRKLGWVLLVGGASVAFPITFHSCDLKVQREAPGDEIAWRRFGTKSPDQQSFPRTDGRSQKEDLKKTLMIGGYVAMVAGFLILLVVPRPPAWIIEEAKHRS